MQINLKFSEFRWFLDSAEIYNPIIMGQMICNMIYLSCAMFGLDLVRINPLFEISSKLSYFFYIKKYFIFPFQQLKHLDFYIVTVLISTFIGISNIFLFCYFGKLATESYANLCDYLYEFNWHELPNDLQKYFILMIGNAQQTLYYSGFGMIILDLETFSKVRMIQIHIKKDTLNRIILFSFLG